MILNKLRRFISKIIWIKKKQKFEHCGKNTFIDLSTKISGLKHISIGQNFNCSKNCEINVWTINKSNPKLLIGDNVTIAPYSYISCANKVKIGDGCLLGVNAFITDNFHGKSDLSEIEVIPNERNIYSKGVVIIGKNVWIGRNVCVMPGVCIGDYVIIGANSVVTHDIPSKCVVAGVPARIIKKLE